MSLDDFKKEFRVHIDYEDVSRNPLSKDYDKAALKRYVRTKNLKLTKELQRKLTKAGIDHATSPSFRQWADKNIGPNQGRQTARTGDGVVRERAKAACKKLQGWQAGRLGDILVQQRAEGDRIKLQGRQAHVCRSLETKWR